MTEHIRRSCGFRLFLAERYSQKTWSKLPMAFAEALKRRIRMKAAYRCCWCKRFGLVEVHHIVPQADNGPDDENNAAPLCPYCHSLYGGNPDLRAQIREKRDWWFKVAARKYPYELPSLQESVENVDRELVRATYDRNAIRTLNLALVQYIHSMLNIITPENAREVTDLILDAIPLDTGVLLPKANVAFEGFCECERESCFGSREKMYCYWSKGLPTWVLTKRLYWRCYDEVIECPECGLQHKRGHVGAEGICKFAA